MTAEMTAEAPPPTAANATPTAMPSGMLCMVTATQVTAPDLVFLLEKRLSLFTATSVNIMSNPPATKPLVSTIKEYSPPASSAGRRSEKKAEASIMPDAPDIIKLKAD